MNTPLTNEERQFNEWIIVFKAYCKVGIGAGSELDIWTELSDRYILVERVDLDELVKFNTTQK